MRHLVLASSLIVALTSPAQGKPVLAVLPPDASAGVRLDDKDLGQLWAAVTKALQSRGAYRMISLSLIQRQLRRKGGQGYERCFDRRCQRALRKSLAADKALSPLVVGPGPRCQLSFVLWDLRQGVAEKSISVRAGCSSKALVAAVKGAVRVLLARPSYAQQARRRCPFGKVVVAPGRCCWPGQYWATSLQDCLGRPKRCPLGMASGAYGCHDPKLPDRLSRQDVVKGMIPVRKEMKACAKRHGYVGFLVLQLEIGPSGKVHRVRWVRPRRKHEARACLIKAVKVARFARSNRGARLTHRFVLR